MSQMKWNESGFRPPLCTYRLNWARRTSWGWWDDWDDTVLQTQDSKFEPWRSEAEHATSRSRRLPTILTFTRWMGKKQFCFFQTAETGNRTPDSGVEGSGANHYPRAPALDVTRAKATGVKKSHYWHRQKNEQHVIGLFCQITGPRPCCFVLYNHLLWITSYFIVNHGRKHLFL